MMRTPDGFITWGRKPYINEMDLLRLRDETDETRQPVEAIKNRFLECTETDAEGRLKLTVTLPDTSALDNLAGSLARLLDVRR